MNLLANGTSWELLSKNFHRKASKSFCYGIPSESLWKRPEESEVNLVDSRKKTESLVTNSNLRRNDAHTCLLAL